MRQIESVKKKETDIVISAGNTGALLVIAKLNLKMIENIDKPAPVSYTHLTLPTNREV